MASSSEKQSPDWILRFIIALGISMILIVAVSAAHSRKRKALAREEANWRTSGKIEGDVDVLFAGGHGGFFRNGKALRS